MTLHTVHVRVNDAATGKPTPVRLRITDAEGYYYAPFGHPAEIPPGRGESVGGSLVFGKKQYAYIDGACEIDLPPGQLTIEISKGIEYQPIIQNIDQPAGKMAMRFTIERVIDSRSQGWLSGDSRCHFLSPHAALLEAQAEDVAVVNLLATEHYHLGFDGQTYQSFPRLEAFSGQRPCLEHDGHMVVVNTHNRHPVLGSLGLLNCHRVVFPLAFGGPDRTDDWSLDDWCGQCHRKKGLVVWTDAFRSEIGLVGEGLADLILGNIDALELTTQVHGLQAHGLQSVGVLPRYYQLLNAGLRVPLIGGSGKASNAMALGAMRTYAAVGRTTNPSYSEWIEAVRAGRTTVTNGPLVQMTIEGGRVRAEAKSLTPFERLQVIRNGEVVATARGSDGLTIRPTATTVETDPVAGPCWLAARCWGPTAFAHTSPIYLENELAPMVPDRLAVQRLDDQLAASRAWVADQGRFTIVKRREHLLDVFDQARRRLQAGHARQSKSML